VLPNKVVGARGFELPVPVVHPHSGSPAFGFTRIRVHPHSGSPAFGFTRIRVPNPAAGPSKGGNLRLRGGPPFAGGSAANNAADPAAKDGAPGRVLVDGWVPLGQKQASLYPRLISRHPLLGGGGDVISVL